MRNLASVQTVASINPIEGADRIVLASFKDVSWQCIISKTDGIKVGDLVCYIEIDSLVPAIPAFAFMESRKYRVKTIKMKGVYSQGLCVPFTFFPDKDFSKFKNGDDLTDFLGIIKYDPEDVQENEASSSQNKWYKPLMRYAFFRKILNFFNEDKSAFPTNYIAKSDETRIQNMPSVLQQWRDKAFFQTEKLEGTSATYIMKRTWLGWKFICCSRNMRLDNADSVWGQVAKKFDLKNKMKEMCIMMNTDILVLQGEIIGPSICGNIYGLDNLDFYVYRMKYRSFGEYEFILPDFGDVILKTYGLKWVPILGVTTLNDFTVESILKFSDGKSVLADTDREGIVYSSFSDIRNPFSFKAVSNVYLDKKTKKEEKQKK